jgi:hypothetical protein
MIVDIQPRWAMSLGAQPLLNVQYLSWAPQATVPTIPLPKRTAKRAMDPLTVVSLVATIAQLIEFGSQVVSKSTELYRSGKGALEENIDLEAATTDLVKLSENLKVLTTVADNGLGTLCEACDKVATQLLQTLDKIKLNKGDRKWQSFWKALKSIWSKKGVQELEHRLVRLQEELNLHIIVGLRYVFLYP